MLNKKALAASLSAAPATYVEDVFSTYLYSGTGSSQTITNNIDLAGEGGLVWIKPRTSTTFNDHILFDTARGTSVSLFTNSTAAQDTNSIGSFDSSGFSVTGSTRTNASSVSYASWTFRKAEKFFDVVTYTGNGANNRQISHNLGSAPGFIVVKNTSGTQGWVVYHRSNGTGKFMFLNSTAAVSTDANAFPTVNSTYFIPTADEANFSLNNNGTTYVAYLFAHDAGGFGDSGSESVISCGSFTTDGSGNATVDLGWEPQWLMFKRTDGASSWPIADNMRGWTVSGNYQAVWAEDTGAEGSSTAVRLNSKGWTISGFGGDRTYIYIAIRRGPMKTPEAGTEVFEPFVDRTSIANKTNGTMGPVDLTMQTQVSDPLGGYHWTTFDRLRGANKYILTASTAAEATDTSVSFDVMGGVKNATWFSSGGVGYNFKRAPGFMDVVCWTADNTYASINHNLGVTPELVIQKRRDGTSNWFVFDGTNLGYLELTDAFFGFSRTLTSTTFQPASTGPSYTYVAYLFASVTGVSKVGSYTGTGNLLQVNCGFTSSARFVLIKRTDTTGDWYVWDSARGIVSGNDPYLLMNSTATEVTNTDYIDTYSSGFEVTAAASTTVNVTGGTYIFLAIA